jgi:hypothetical protein
MTRKKDIEDLGSEAPRLAGMEKINPYSVPNGYFEDLQSAILARTTLAPIAKHKVIQLWMRYAAAACITLVAGTFVYLNQQSAAETPNFDIIPDQEIVSYLQTHVDESDTELMLVNTEKLHLEEKNISTQELENYINQTL